MVLTDDFYDFDEDNFIQRSEELKRKAYLKERRRRRKIRLYTRRTTIVVVMLLIVALPIFTFTHCVRSCTSGSTDAASSRKQTSAETAEVTAKSSVTETNTTKTSVDKIKISVSADGTAADTNSYTPIEGPVDDSFFDNTVFVGDSISLGLQMYVEGLRSDGTQCLGKAYIFANGSLGYINSKNLPAGNSESVLPLYKGKQQNVQDVAADRKAERVYIMLGMNDISLADTDDIMEYVKYMVDSIKEKSPNVRVCLESVTPRIAAYANETLSNDKIRAFDAALRQFCDDNDCSYIDVYSVVVDNEGNLKEDYCGDPDAMGLHFSSEGLEQIVEYFRQHPDGI